MKHLICFLFALVCSSGVTAGSQYTGNPNLPYSPACAKLPGPYSPLTNYGELAKFLDTKVDLLEFKSGAKVAVDLRGYRLNCSEAGRSLIWLQFVVPEALADEPDLAVELPQAVVELPSGKRIAMNLAEQPHLWGANNEIDRSRKYLGPREGGVHIGVGVQLNAGYYFVLDSYSPLSESASGITATQYNDRFTLVLRYPPHDLARYSVPSLSESFPYGNEGGDLPISGRLSGLWVVDGAEDQGFTITVSSLPLPANPPPLPDSVNLEALIIFLTHATYDADGSLLWLSGASRFEQVGGIIQNVDSATIRMTKVNHGQFLGDKAAERVDAGQIRIKRVADCNTIWIEYDYRNLGLGMSTVRLQRIFSLETAGYECRDFEARVAAVYE